MGESIRLPDDFIDKMLLEMRRERQERKSFFESSEFDKLLNIIKNQGRIDHDDLAYRTQVISGLTSDDFGKVCDSVFYVLENLAERIPGNFEHYAIDYKGVRFNLMIGQGATYWTERSSLS